MQYQACCVLAGAVKGRRVLHALAFLAVLLILPGSTVKADERAAGTQPIVRRAVKSDVLPPLRSIPPSLLPQSEEIREMADHPLPKLHSSESIDTRIPGIDPALQISSPVQSMPPPVQNFEGVNNVNGVLPPDTNGDVGPNHYVQWVNLSFGIYDKTGTLLVGPLPGRSLWSKFGPPCETTNHGDPIAQYDHLANRWLLSQFALPNFPNGPFYQCIAVSQTPDPTGAYFRYAFLISDTKMNDYPKIGVWPNGYYMAVNQFMAPSLSWAGQGVVAFNREKILAGDPTAQMVYFDLLAMDPRFGGMLPSDLEGPPPPLGSPDYFVEVDGQPDFPTDRLNVFEFHVDWIDPTLSTFTGPLILETQPFNPNLCAFRPCVTQPETTVKLDTLSDRLMYRLQYRNFGDREAMVVNHTVNVAAMPFNQAGIRWYELRKGPVVAANWSIFQQGTYAPDTDDRWMGSIAMDSGGNMALGFSVSGASTFPSIRYVGRLVDDPLGTLPQGETDLFAGSGSQTHPSGRWGDYSMMAVEPNGCTFWYTQEYYGTTSVAGWNTRIGSFQFPTCVPAVPDPGSVGGLTR